MKTKIFAILSLLIVIPNFSYAAALGSLVDLANTLATGVVKSLGYLAFTVAVVAFLWGMVNFIWSARNGDAGKGVENGKQFMLWGLIALFVMFSVWGIIIFAQGVLDIKGSTSITIPNIELLGSTPIQSTTQSQAQATVSPCPNGPDSACTVKDASGNTVSGFCNPLNQCVPSTAIPQGITTVCPNGPRSVCTITDNNGPTLRKIKGTCNTQGQCDTSCTEKINGVVYNGFYDDSEPQKCIPTLPTP